MERIKKRTDFIAAREGRRASRAGFVLQAHKRNDDGPARVGFTVTKKIGNAVVRNRIKRRLREAIASVTSGDALMLQNAQNASHSTLISDDQPGEGQKDLVNGPEVASSSPSALANRGGYDYVLIGRRPALHLAFDVLVDDVKNSLKQVHRKARHRKTSRHRSPQPNN